MRPCRPGGAGCFRLSLSEHEGEAQSKEAAHARRAVPLGQGPQGGPPPDFGERASFPVSIPKGSLGFPVGGPAPYRTGSRTPRAGALTWASAQGSSRSRSPSPSRSKKARRRWGPGGVASGA